MQGVVPFHYTTQQYLLQNGLLPQISPGFSRGIVVIKKKIL